MQARLKEHTSFAEGRRQSQEPGKSKNSCSSGRLALTNLKRSGFVFINDD